MIYLFHGDHTAQSRHAYREARSAAHAQIYTPVHPQVGDIIQRLSGTDLFAATVPLALENIHSLRSNKEKDLIISYLSSLPAAVDVYLWEEKSLTKKQLTALGTHVKAQEFSLPKTLYAYLDSLYPHNRTKSLTLLDEVCNTEPVELVLFMTIRHFRLLVALSDTTAPRISEIKQVSPWQEKKLQTHARMISHHERVLFLDALLHLDIGIKSGTSALDTKAALEQIIITHLR
jgi:hypothetical protein